MAPSHDLSFIQKRDAELGDLPAGGIAGIVIGIILIILVSIWCCCPCWKKQAPILSRDDDKEDVGHERGVVMGGLDAQKTGSTNISKDASRDVTVISPMTTGDGTAYGMRGGAGDRSTIVSALSTSDTVRGDEYRPGEAHQLENTTISPVAEVDGRSHGGRVNELDGAPGLYEAANTPAAMSLSPPPRYDQIPRRPVAAELPAELPASVARPEKTQ